MRRPEHDLHKAKTIKFNYATELAVHDNLITLINFQLQIVILWGDSGQIARATPKDLLNEIIILFRTQTFADEWKL